MKKLTGIIAFMTIIVSGVRTQNLEHLVAKGDTLYSIALEYGVSLSTLMESNDISDPTKLAVGTRLVIPRFYVAAKGDTLWGISRAFGLTLGELRELNGYTDSYELKEGDVVSVPGKIEQRITSAAITTAAKTPPVQEPMEKAPAGADEGQDRVPFWPHGGTMVKREGKIPGTDFVGKPGDPVYAVAGGVVVYRAAHRMFLNLVMIESYAGYLYVYGGIDVVSVDSNERVSASTRIGTLGVDPNTGDSRAFFTVMKDGQIVPPEVAPRG